MLRPREIRIVEAYVRITLRKVAAAALALSSMLVLLSCDCNCKNRPGSVGSAPSRAPGDPGKPGALWHFAVSGDSRNCGDVIMPAVAAGAKKDGAMFYWHLGDLRAIYDFDQDMQQIAKLKGQPLNISQYLYGAWEDFKHNQIQPFKDASIPYYLGIGNHETIPPMTRCGFAKSFSEWLEQDGLQDFANKPLACVKGTQTAAEIKAGEGLSDEGQKCIHQCVDCDLCAPKTYYHFAKAGIDFIYLDNASDEQFDKPQMEWLEGVLTKDAAKPEISTFVVGMHKALPWSVTCDHSMNETAEGTKSGEIVYRWLLDLQSKGKKVYVVASHSHYFMSDIYKTKRWHDAGVLPGWIVGTGGAQRYPLPPGAELTKSRTYVYGYLLGTVFSDGHIDFDFTEIKEKDIPPDVKLRYTEKWIGDACFDGNRKPGPTQEPAYCKDVSAQ
ncbi:MAG TPA: hypothetical protein VND65_08160 [Candidatus Binatia bacterium]|nr:hypothetical protein [Candidatus Binatia bacterium]